MLSEEDLRRFGTEGYLVLPGVVPEELLVAADLEVDDLPDHEEASDPRRTWFLSPADLPACEAVLRCSPVLGLARALSGPDLDLVFDHVQVATTVPPWSHVPGGPHVDGQDHEPPASFTLLAGVLLTDQVEPATGNLWVWPGSHRDHVRLFHERGTRALQATAGHATLLDPPLILGAGQPVLGRRGDLVLCHHLLGHNSGGNTSPHVRRTLYYRLAAAGHRERWEATYLDVLLEMPPVRAALVR